MHVSLIDQKGPFSRKERHVPGIDTAKMVCAFGVVCIHLAPTESFATSINRFFSIFVVPFFFIVSLKFHIDATSRSTFNDRLHQLIKRLAIPYFCWTLVYGAALFAKDLFTKNERQWDWAGYLFFGQSGVQLYFLPLLMVAQMTALAGATLFNRSEAAYKGLALLIASLVVLSVGMQRDYFGWSASYSVLGYIPLAWVCVQTSELMLSHKRFTGCIGAVFLSIAFCLTGNLGSAIPASILVSGYLGGLGAYLLSLSAPQFASRQIASSSFGVYLVHALVIEAIETIWNLTTSSEPRYDAKSLLLTGTVVFLFSVMAVLCLRGVKPLAILLLGENLRLKGTTTNEKLH